MNNIQKKFSGKTFLFSIIRLDTKCYLNLCTGGKDGNVQCIYIFILYACYIYIYVDIFFIFFYLIYFVKLGLHILTLHKPILTIKLYRHT